MSFEFQQWYTIYKRIENDSRRELLLDCSRNIDLSGNKSPYENIKSYNSCMSKVMDYFDYLDNNLTNEKLKSIVDSYKK